MATISRLKPGQTVWDAHKYKMGNTRLFTWGTWPVYVHEVDPDGQWVRASWNGNPDERFYARRVAKWRVIKPEMESCGFGQERPVRRKSGEKADG